MTSMPVLMFDQCLTCPHWIILHGTVFKCFDVDGQGIPGTIFPTAQGTHLEQHKKRDKLDILYELVRDDKNDKRALPALSCAQQQPRK